MWIATRQRACTVARTRWHGASCSARCVSPSLHCPARPPGLVTAVINWPVGVGMSSEVLLPELPAGDASRLTRPSTLVRDVEADVGHPLPARLDDTARAEIAAWSIRRYRPHFLLLH